MNDTDKDTKRLIDSINNLRSKTLTLAIKLNFKCGASAGIEILEKGKVKELGISLHPDLHKKYFEWAVDANMSNILKNMSEMVEDDIQVEILKLRERAHTLETLLEDSP